MQIKYQRDERVLGSHHIMGVGLRDLVRYVLRHSVVRMSAIGVGGLGSRRRRIRIACVGFAHRRRNRQDQDQNGNNHLRQNG